MANQNNIWILAPFNFSEKWEYCDKNSLSFILLYLDEILHEFEDLHILADLTSLSKHKILSIKSFLQFYRV